MKTVLDEVISDEINSDHINRRVEDWECRLNALYRTVTEWLPEGWEARQGVPAHMHEELMRKFDVDAREIPTLELHNQSKSVVRLVPHALWIIGSNGRIDMKGKESKYFIVDTAENFAPSKWEAGCLEHRCEREVLSREWMRRILN